MSKFEDRLWREIVRKHGADLAEMTRSASKQAPRARPRVLAGTSVGLAVAGVAAALVLSAANSPPAFAVSRNADGIGHGQTPEDRGDPRREREARRARHQGEARRGRPRAARSKRFRRRRCRR